ncbi:MAG: translation initiation factor IF-3 [Oscillospiraceae bacterium]|nr:translation initiation factor IF-3 [Oscillospiraceae bacterium]
MNEKIRCPEVRLIGAAGEQVGIVPTDEAQRMALDADLDLVMIAPTAAPPVCKIIDYGKFKFEQSKKEKENKKNQKVVTIKEIRLSSNIGEHDIAAKAKHAFQFLSEGDKVKVSIRFRGREITHSELGRKVLLNFVERCKEVGEMEGNPRMEGRSMHLLISPIKK